MNPERQAFTLQIEQNPEDNTLRLVFADWLDERGESELAAKYRQISWRQGDLAILIGHTVNDLWLSDDRLVFGLKSHWIDSKLMAYVSSEVSGDCCSCSWYYAIRIGQLFKSKIIGFYEADCSWINTDDGLCRQDYDSCYGVGILTETGFAEVYYRCSSNGYYGGIMASTHLESVNLDGMIKVTADWTAEKKCD